MIKPMLAGKAPDDLSTLRYPVMVSPKLDGVRALVVDGVVMSRTGKPIPNLGVQARFAHLEGADGELIVGAATEPDCYRKTVSVVMSQSKPAEGVRFHIFDLCDSLSPYIARYEKIQRVMQFAPHSNVRVVHSHDIGSEAGLLNVENSYVQLGFEGVMVRDPESFYKHGRATTKEGILLKLKRFDDMEAEVRAVLEQMQNCNDATKNAVGRSERSTAASGMLGKATMGALVVAGLNGPYKDVLFQVGTGFDDAERAEWWTAKVDIEDDQYRPVIKVKYFASGAKDKPRFPVFLGIRADADMPLERA